jgi:hypothetical protein
MPLLPPLVLEVGSGLQVPSFRNFTYLDPQVGLIRNLGARHFVSVTLLTRGYFLILFENEEGATSTRKLTSVEWNGLSLSFSRYTPNFDARAQGAEALLTHTIKVQFPDLHE